MNEVFIQFIQYMVAYIGVIVLLMFALNFLTKKWLFIYLKVKMSQGRLTMTRVNSVADTYYKAGQWSEGFYTFKLRSKEEKRIPISEKKYNEYFNREWGVNVIDINEEGNSIYSRLDKNTHIYQNFDSGGISTLFLRFKNRPVLEDKKIIIIIILLIVIMFTAFFCAYKINEIITLLKGVLALGGNV